jgi:hypothetical protein
VVERPTATAPVPVSRPRWHPTPADDESKAKVLIIPQANMVRLSALWTWWPNEEPVAEGADDDAALRRATKSK